jgi:phosphatidylglycerol:prolipoprotein diacylglycerol transferase
MHPTLYTFDLFGAARPVYSYPILLALGVIAGVLFILRSARRQGVDPQPLVVLSLVVLVASLVGAHLTYALVTWSFDGAGLVFYGGLVGGLAAFYVYCKSSALPLARTVDLFAPGLALGHAIGRVGCYLAGCCYGKPTASVLGVRFPLDPTSARHPTQLYEAAGELALFALLVSLSPRKRFHGQLAVVYLIGYAALRFALELIRDDTDRGAMLSLSTSQWIALAMIPAALVFRARARRVLDEKGA